MEPTLVTIACKRRPSGSAVHCPFTVVTDSVPEAVQLIQEHQAERHPGLARQVGAAVAARLPEQAIDSGLLDALYAAASHNGGGMLIGCTRCGWSTYEPRVALSTPRVSLSYLLKLAGDHGCEPAQE